MSNSAAPKSSAGPAGRGERSPKGKGKGKGRQVDEPGVEPMDEDGDEEEDDDDDDDEEEEEVGDEEEEEEEDTFEEIDPSNIVTGGRRTRGVRVDYSSKEAQERAGFTGEERDDDEDDEMKH